MFVNENKMISLTITITNKINDYNYNEKNNNENSSLFSLIQKKEGQYGRFDINKNEKCDIFIMQFVSYFGNSCIHEAECTHASKSFKALEQIVKQRVNTHNFAYSLNYCN